jgi:hypothetical protein
MTTIVSLTSIATMFVAGWMTFMYFVLRHAGYVWRAAIAAVICLGAATLVAGRPPAALRIPVGVWGAALAAFGAWALFAPGDDGWVLIAGTLFIAEGALAVLGSVRRVRSA